LQGMLEEVGPGVVALIYGGSLQSRVEASLKVASRLALKGPALFLSIYKGFSSLVVSSAHKLSLQGLLNKALFVHVEPSQADVEKLADGLVKVRPPLTVYDQVFTAIYAASLGDIEVKSRLNTCLSLIKAASRRHCLTVLLLDRAKEDGSPMTPRLILRHVDLVVQLPGSPPR